MYRPYHTETSSIHKKKMFLSRRFLLYRFAHEIRHTNFEAAKWPTTYSPAYRLAGSACKSVILSLNL